MFIIIIVPFSCGAAKWESGLGAANKSVALQIDRDVI